MAIVDSSPQQIEDQRLAHLPANDRAALAEMLTQLHEYCSDDLLHVVLFGSKARGDFHEESDIDLLIVVRALDNEREKQISSVVHSLGLEHCVVITAITRSEADYVEMQREGRLLFRNIQRDGVVLWTKLPEHSVAWEQTVDEPTRRKYIQIYWGYVQDDLSAAHQLVSNHPRGAANRAYYAVFHATSAALLWHGIERARHSGIYSALGQFLVSPGLIEPEYSDLFDMLRKARETHDYSVTAPILTSERAQEYITAAERFVARIARYLHEVGALG